jgi:hypothetical protein
MNVLSVTLIVSLCLTAIFVAAFLFSHLRRRDSGPEHESLLPLEEEPAAPPARKISSLS